MSNFENIRFYNDAEVRDALQYYLRHPMIRTLFQFTFPQASEKEIDERVLACASIKDFQTSVIAETVEKVLHRSSEGLSFSGFENLKKDESYLFITTHRDIILDTCLLNYVLMQMELTMTASAIGDNLVGKPFLMALAKLNRNFLVRRGLGPREMLKSSMNLSEYIRDLLVQEKRSVWMAQREGRTKDGNDQTQQGVLKMLAMARGEDSVADYFGKLKIVPVAISYEFDPTDVLKMPELLAKRMEKEYIKSPNEDFNTILKGAMGQKGRIHMSAAAPINIEDLEALEAASGSVNEQLQRLTALIDERIHETYKLWPSNYIAYDLLNAGNKFCDYYNIKEKRQFERRVSKRIDMNNPMAMNSYLLMYANPVVNQHKLHED